MCLLSIIVEDWLEFGQVFLEVGKGTEPAYRSKNSKIVREK
jgi:hypothetical protein